MTIGSTFSNDFHLNRDVRPGSVLGLACMPFSKPIVEEQCLHNRYVDDTHAYLVFKPDED